MPSCFNRLFLLFLHVHDDIYIIHYLIHSENEKQKQKRDDVTLMRKNNHASKAKQNNVNVIYQIAFLEY